MAQFVYGNSNDTTLGLVTQIKPITPGVEPAIVARRWPLSSWSPNAGKTIVDRHVDIIGCVLLLPLWTVVC